jgi:hypothetical protein
MTIKTNRIQPVITAKTNRTQLVMTTKTNRIQPVITAKTNRIQRKDLLTRIKGDNPIVLTYG